MDTDRRAYVRDTLYRSKIKISLDGDIWHDAWVFDISAGGLKFVTNIMFEIGVDLWFDLNIPEFLSKKQMKVQGTISRQEGNDEKGMFIYGVGFKNLSKEVRIGIDESVLFRERTRQKKKNYSD
ncbi:MAG: PilZ domain-containing protein [Oscillospiraceae bacterium]|nr:PilZ domain-containing protein [Oscillospiraceae bacterium]